MKRTIMIYVITDIHGNTKDARGNAYGWYPACEKELCESYCRKTGLTYKKQMVEVW